jgi:hypothetical protein
MSFEFLYVWTKPVSCERAELCMQLTVAVPQVRIGNSS